LRSHALSSPGLVKFAIAMAVIVGVPPLARRARFPVVVAQQIQFLGARVTRRLFPSVFADTLLGLRLPLG
jgi:hypothetical protein